MYIKRTMMAAAVLLTVCSKPAKAQMKMGADTIAIDQIEYRVTYDAKQVDDTVSMPYLYNRAQMRLDIGKNITRFYNLSHMQFNEALKQMIMSGSIDMSKVTRVRCMLWEFYKNYPEQGKTLFLENVAMTNYQCIEDVETPEWQVVPDSTVTIIGYTCQLAKAQFKGRTWYAWYAEDIPMAEGPWKLYGLPGLVLRAYDTQRQFCFDAVGLETLKGKAPLQYVKKDNKAETVSQTDLVKIKQRQDPTQVYRRDVKSYDKDGNPIKVKPRKRVFNPIER